MLYFNTKEKNIKCEYFEMELYNKKIEEIIKSINEKYNLDLCKENIIIDNNYGIFLEMNVKKKVTMNIYRFIKKV